METHENKQQSEFDFIFSDEKITSNANIEGQFFESKVTKKDLRFLKRYDDLNKIFPETLKNDSALHMVSSDNFGSIELLKVLNERLKIKELYLCTFSYNSHFIELLRILLTSNIKIGLYVDSTIKNRKPHLYSQVVNLKDDFTNFDVKFHYKMHQKVTLIKTENQNITVESSANYSENRRLENFQITENKELYNFHKSIILKIIKDINPKNVR